MPVLSRRSFALGLGASLLASPFGELLRGRGQASADTSKPAKRLVIFFTPNGTVPKRWRPSGSGASFAFPAGSILEPLAPVKQDVIVCDGVDFVGVSNHEGGMAAMLTGGGGVGSSSAGMSVDQYVAAKIGQGDRFPSLELGVQTSAWGGNVQTRMCYGGPGVFVPPDDDPGSVYNRLFGDLVEDGNAVDKVLLRRKSVLDLVKQDLEGLKPRLGSLEQQKLEAHLDAVRKLELGLTGSGAVKGCGKPAAPAVDAQDGPSFPAVGALQMDLLVTALACGMTRVASLQWSHTVGPHVFSWLGLSEGHHALSHIDDSNAAGVEHFVKAERWFAEQFASLVDRLKKTPDPAGGSLLDSTLVVWAKEMGDGRLHDCFSVPFVLAGGGVFKPGRYLQLGGVPHQKLLVSICQAMGLSNQTFGDATKGQGPLDALLG
jgi:hypothetical protein